jgi:GNAT superfamily N-acetyltransferase
MRVWYARFPAGPDGAFVMAAVVGDDHPDRTAVDVPADADLDTRGLVLYRGRYDRAGRLQRVAVNPAVVPRAPALWYLEVPEPDDDPPAMHLVVFATADRPAGTVVDIGAAAHLDPTEGDRVGSLRWWTPTGQAHQVYVAPRARRRGIATALTLAGAALCLGRRWPSLWGTGELTDLGAAWTGRAVWASRVQPRTRHLPPMTPDAEAAGVPRRLLEPDPDGG